MSETPPGEGEARIRRALLISLAIAGVVALGIVIVVFASRDENGTEVPDDLAPGGPVLPTAEPVAVPRVVFTEVARQAGIDFQHVTGAYGERLLPETMGGGVAFLDHDNDGDQDLLLVDSGEWPWRGETNAAGRLRLFRNRGDGTFENVSASAGLAGRFYGMGVAVADYDADGYVDVFVTAVGRNLLLRNREGATFEDVTAATGVGGATDAWSTGAAFFDADGDGDLDLFVCNYVGWSPDIDRAVDFRLTGIGRAYGPPTDFPGTDSYLYRNDGGVFTDISAEAGIHVANPSTGAPVGKGLAVLPVDLDDDGRLDLVVANDTVRNFVFHNQGGGRYREVGIDTGLAFDNTGSATGAMGVDALRYDGGALLGVAIGNFANEMSSFYVTRAGESVFSDDAIVAGIGAPSRRALTFGLAFIDADLDGRLDLVAANGHVEPEIQRVQASQNYAQPAQLFWNCGTDCPRRFVLADDVGGLGTPRVGRGLAYADIDGDGDLDLALTQAGGRFALLRNDQDLGHNWARFTLRANGANPNAIGARITVTTAGLQQTRTVMPTRSYLSQVELPVTFGLGNATVVQRVDVTWPDGVRDSWTGLAINRSHVLDRGGP
ncbi:MAG: CRTAC1 family protein [Gammaproteobacteria bacterium]|nr:CRTAC1 family protein [Gammaproteobacteria bacterium]